MNLHVTPANMQAPASATYTPRVPAARAVGVVRGGATRTVATPVWNIAAVQRTVLNSAAVSYTVLSSVASTERSGRASSAQPSPHEIAHPESPVRPPSGRQFAVGPVRVWGAVGRIRDSR